MGIYWVLNLIINMAEHFWGDKFLGSQGVILNADTAYQFRKFISKADKKIS